MTVASLDPRAIARSAAPALAILAVALLLLQVEPARAAVASFLRRYPHVLPGAAVLLALAFRRSRALYGVAVLTIAERTLQTYGGDSGFELNSESHRDCFAFLRSFVAIPAFGNRVLWRE